MEAITFAKKTLEDQTAAGKSLASAKSPQEVVELQMAYSKSAMDAYMAEVVKLSQLVTASATESMKPFSERIAAMTQLAGRSASSGK